MTLWSLNEVVTILAHCCMTPDFLRAYAARPASKELLTLLTPYEYPLLDTSSLPPLLLPDSKTLNLMGWSGMMSSGRSGSTLIDLE